jgi:hypothetical protein
VQALDLGSVHIVSATGCCTLALHAFRINRTEASVEITAIRFI